MLKHLKNRSVYLSSVKESLKEKLNESLANDTTYTQEDFDKADKRIGTCIAIIQTNSPFFAVLIKKLLLLPNIYMPTMATDGNAILYNPKFTNSITEAECIFVLQHEILHCALQHFIRLDGRDAKKWNYATDFAINWMLQEMYNDSNPEGAKRLDGALYDPKYADMKSEDIYDQLDKDGNGPPQSPSMGQPGQGQPGQPGQGQGEGEDCEDCDGTGESQEGEGSGEGEGEEGSGNGSGSCSSCNGTGKEPGSGSGSGGSGGDEPGQGVTPGGNGWDVGGVVSPEQLGKYYDDPDNPGGKKAAKDLEKDWEVAIKKAMKQAGNMPGNVKRMIGDIIDPVINWKKALKKFINSMAKKSQYKLPNRRHIHSGKYLPALKRSMDGITNIVVGIDTSGSIDDEMLQTYLSETYDILKQFDPEKTIIHYIDTDIRSTDVVKKKGKPDPSKAKGGGGTAFKPLFDWIDSNLKPKEVSVVIYFTDLYGDTSFKKPKYYNKVIWALEKNSRDEKVPWGKKIVLDKNFKNK